MQTHADTLTPDFVFVKLNETDSELDQFKVRKKDEVFLRKILVMLESHCD